MAAPRNEAPRPYKQKLIEVAIPLADINRESAKEKAIRHGHPSTLHLWWARRPLAACRAVLFAQLVDDPSAHTDDEEEQEIERERLHGIIKRLIKWESSHDETVLEEARREIVRSCGPTPPPILDPFAGGGSIPLEAQRLDLEAHAADLNPVAVLISKAILEIPAQWAGRPPVFPGAAQEAHSWPRATGLAEDVRRYGAWLCDEAQKRISQHYPKAVLPDGSGTTAIAWIWARTITCPNPACGGAMPLVRSFWLGKKSGKERYIHPVPDGKRVRFEIRGPSGTPIAGTASRKGAVCLLCHVSVELSHIRAEGRNGRMGAQLMAIVAEGRRQRHYLPPNAVHEEAANVPSPDEVPNEELAIDPRNLWCTNYGLTRFSDLFTARQLDTFTTFGLLLREIHELARGHGAPVGYADAITTYLAIAASRVLDRNSSVGSWNSHPSMEQLRGVFARQSIPMTWDYAEGNPFSHSSGNISESVEWVANILRGLPAKGSGTVVQQDAGLVDTENRLVVATDPPYYDNVGYANLSDFFYVWLRRWLINIHPDLMSTMLTPKSEEMVADSARHGGPDKAKEFFERRFRDVFEKIREGTPNGYPISFFYAYKQTGADSNGDRASTGWETLLSSLLSAGWSVTGTWPIRTEFSGRTRSINSNALASSIVLTCRPRAHTAKATDRRGLIAALREELPGTLHRLQQGSIAPVDLPQAAIGPGMAVFSRYARVNEPDGSPMRIRTALTLINQVLDEVLSAQEGDFGPETRWCVEWFKSYGFTPGPFGVADTLSKAKNTTVSGLEQAGLLQARAGKVTLRSVHDIDGERRLAGNERVSEWEICLHLAKRLHDNGDVAAAELMAAVRDKADLSAVKELSYLLFSIADRKGWADAAVLFNGLGTSWSDLEGAARKPGYAGSTYVQDPAIPDE